MENYFAVTKNTEGMPEKTPLKEWLQLNPKEIPNGLDIATSTVYRLKRILKNKGWVIEELSNQILFIKPDENNDISFADEIIILEEENLFNNSQIVNINAKQNNTSFFFVIIPSSVVLLSLMLMIFKVWDWTVGFAVSSLVIAIFAYTNDLIKPDFSKDNPQQRAGKIPPFILLAFAVVFIIAVLISLQSSTKELNRKVIELDRDYNIAISTLIAQKDDIAENKNIISTLEASNIEQENYISSLVTTATRNAEYISTLESTIKNANIAIPATPTAIYWCNDVSIVKLFIGAEAEVISEIDINLRRTPEVPAVWDANIITEISMGSHLSVIDGPVCAHEGTWWKIRIDNGTVGWIREYLPNSGYLVEITQ